MQTTRRDFLKASSAIAAALGFRLPDVLGAEEGPQAVKRPAVVWLQAQSCSGCSVSLLNTIFYMTADKLLRNTVSLEYHPTLMAAAGGNAVLAAQAALKAKDYILVVEGAIPTAADGRFCYLWPGLTALEGVRQFQRNARFTVAVGTCAAFGGMPGGRPNPTGAKSVSTVLEGAKVVNIPGCPAHPDWIVGTVASLLKNGEVPPLDSLGRPREFFARKLHDRCPYHERRTSDGGKCQKDRGCKGKQACTDCGQRKWNSGAAGTPGVNWCVAAGSPCLGCTEPGFPDGMSPFYLRGGRGGERGRGRGGD